MSEVAYRLYSVARRLSRSRISQSLVPQAVRAWVQARLLPRAITLMPDRVYLQNRLLPAIAGLSPARIVDVGVQTYSAHHAAFFPNSEYWTIDNNAAVACYGAAGRHIIGDIVDLVQHFGRASVDVLILNGVIGFGIDDLYHEERVIAECRKALSPGGWLLVGWDQSANGGVLVSGVSSFPPVDPTLLDAVATGFKHCGPSRLPARATFDDCSHVFDWFHRAD